MRHGLVTAALAARRILPEPVKGMLRASGVGRAVQKVLRRNSAQTGPAYDVAALTAAIAPPGADRVLGEPAEVWRLGGEFDVRAKQAVVDASSLDEENFVNLVSILKARRLDSPRLLPPGTVLATAKQAWTPLVHANGVRTRVFVHNYFAKNYAIDDVVTVLLFGHVGDVVRHLATRILWPDETAMWVSDELVLHTELDGLEAGSLTALAVHPAMRRIATPEFRFVVAIESARGSGVVHSLPAVRFGVPQDVTNGTKGYVTPATSRLVAVKALGEPPATFQWRDTAVVESQGARAGSVTADAPASSPGWAALTFTFAQPMRTAQGFYIGRDAEGGLFVHHDQGAHRRPPRAYSPSAAFLERRDLACLCAPLFNAKGAEFSVVFDPRNMVNRYRAVDVRICSDTGDVRASECVPVGDGITVLDLAPLRRRAVLHESDCGYVQIVACPDGADVRDFVDAIILFGFFHKGARLLDTVEAGTSPYATFRPIVERGFVDRRRLAYRAKKFAPFVCDAEWRPLVWTVNQGLERDSGIAELTLSLREPGRSESRRYRLRPGQARLWDLEKEFGLAVASPGSAEARTVWLESRDANLFGIYVYEDRHDPLRFGLDHLTGG